MAIHETARGGYSTEKAIKNGWADSRYQREWHRSQFLENELPAPVSTLEINLNNARTFEAAAIQLMNFDYEIFVPGFNLRLRPNPFKASEAAALERETKGRTYLYYFFLGLVRDGDVYGVRYCQCCAWRLVAPDAKKYCQTCCLKQNDLASRTQHRQQMAVASSLKNNRVVQAFLDVRSRGERYLLERAIGLAPPPAEKLPIDPYDITPDPEYRRLKVALSELWMSCNSGKRSMQRASTDHILMTLAADGYSKAEAADAVGLSRAAITKACARNTELKTMFEQHSKDK